MLKNSTQASDENKYMFKYSNHDGWKLDKNLLMKKNIVFSPLCKYFRLIKLKMQQNEYANMSEFN